MMSPQMVEMMKSMDFNQDKVNAQFKEMGLKPEDVISKVRIYIILYYILYII